MTMPRIAHLRLRALASWPTVGLRVHYGDLRGAGLRAAGRPASGVEPIRLRRPPDAIGHDPPFVGVDDDRGIERQQTRQLTPILATAADDLRSIASE
jgi:hypothetical protein